MGGLYVHVGETPWPDSQGKICSFECSFENFFEMLVIGLVNFRQGRFQRSKCFLMNRASGLALCAAVSLIKILRISFARSRPLHPVSFIRDGL